MRIKLNNKKLSLFILILFLLTSCSKVTTVTSKGVTQYYGINLIGMKNKDENLTYSKIEGLGLIYGGNSLTLGYVKQEQIYADPKVCQAILIVDANRTDMDNVLQQLKNICIIRR